MENTRLNQAKFNALYWEQKVGCSRYSKNFTINKSNIGSVEYLQLKSLQSISDEDAQKIGYENKKEFDDCFKINGFKGFFTDEADKLRELGYLIGYNGLTPDQIISYGWAKI